MNMTLGWRTLVLLAYVAAATAMIINPAHGVAAVATVALSHP
jgi:hypothetical protein